LVEERKLKPPFKPKINPLPEDSSDSNKDMDERKSFAIKDSYSNFTYQSDNDSLS